MDVLCLNDLDVFGGELDDPLAELEQDNYHRLITPPGGHPNDPNFGLGIQRMLSGVKDGSIGALVELELRKDARNGTIDVLVTEEDAETQRIDITVETDDGLLEMEVGLSSDGTTELR